MAKKVIKVYAVPGCTQCSMVIPFLGGLNTLRVNFGDAVMDAYNVPLAKAEIKTQVYQEAIENSAQFKSGKIVLLREIGGEAPEDKEDERMTEYADVKSLQKARDILMRQHGVELSLLQNKESILREAERANVSFPNVKF